MTIPSTIHTWQKATPSFGIILPNAWFGRPYDNQHEITWLEDRKYRLLIEVDEQMLLILTKTPQFELNVDGKDLVMSNFLRLTFERLAYSDLSMHTESFDKGELRFVGY
jgi:hypothetical protein